MSKNQTIRGARLEFSCRFQDAIRQFSGLATMVQLMQGDHDSVDRTMWVSLLPAEIIAHVIGFLVGADSSAVALVWTRPLKAPLPDPRFTIVGRKRPVFDREVNVGEYDTLTCFTGRGSCIAHDARLDRSHNTFIDHREFVMDRMYDEHALTSDVFALNVLPLVQRALAGFRATFIAFGQTGTGKTFTVFQLQQQLANFVFSAANTVASVELEVFEMRGRQCFDLLHDRKRVKVLQGGDGFVHVVGAQRVSTDSPAALLDAFAAANTLRTVAATANNAQSSRSHCVCRLRFTATAAAAEEAAGAPEVDDISRGMLTLVDLAGSERVAEQAHHSKTARLESADINTSLMTLKDCFRALTELDTEQEVVVEKQYADGTKIYQAEMDNDASTDVVERFVVRSKAGGAIKQLRMPFRAHVLTTLLKDSFTNPEHRTCVLATLSPTPSDLEHTRRTLELVCSMRGRVEQMTRVTRHMVAQTKQEYQEKRPLPRWDAKRVQAWVAKLGTELEPEEAAKLKLPARIDGKALVRLTSPRLANYTSGDRALAQKIYTKVRETIKVGERTASENRQRTKRVIYGECQFVGSPSSKVAPAGSAAAAADDEAPSPARSAFNANTTTRAPTAPPSPPPAEENVDVANLPPAPSPDKVPREAAAATADANMV